MRLESDHCGYFRHFLIARSFCRVILLAGAPGRAAHNSGVEIDSQSTGESQHEEVLLG